MATTIQDLVCIHIDSKPAFFARIEDVRADVKPGWWQVRLLVLTHPLQVFTWILEEGQINGAPFTMGGTPVSLEKIVAPPSTEDTAGSAVSTKNETGNDTRKETAKVVSILDRIRDK